MAESGSLPPELDPSRYVEKVSLATGEVLDEPILPEQLLVHKHRDYHVVDVQARRLMSRIVSATGDEELARRRMKEIRALGKRASEALARALRADPEAVSKSLFGLKSKEYFFRFKKHPYGEQEIRATLERLRRQAAERYAAARAGGEPAIRLLLTGGTGFIGKEILWQAAHDEAIAEVVVLIRPKIVRDRGTGEVRRRLSPEERGARLLRQLWLDDDPLRRKFRFVAGDVEEPDLGLAGDDLARLARRITHVVHCAASVAFDAPYEESFRANVVGTLNALRFSHKLQTTPGSPFVAHVSIETSYIHGRQVKAVAREDEIVFPRNFYNNYYELTKAMASLESERFMLSKGLRVIQLCPAIVIGDSRTGNNRGDTKVVNAPVNLFGRAHAALSERKGSFFERSKTSMLARMACVFPGDASAEINLIPVDRVVEGILASLKRPQAIGERVHLATDNRVSAEEIQRIVQQEVGVKVKLAEPTLHRNVTLPVLTTVLCRLKQERLARALEKLGTIFGGYSEWGQTVHAVGNDVRVLGLSPARPDARLAFRMLCRHNRYVQEFGKIRDPDEISRREKIWAELIAELEERWGGRAATMPAAAFQRAVEEALDLERFERRSRTPPAAPSPGTGR